MATTDIEQQLAAQQADYLKKMEESGQLPTVISNAWNEAGGAETTALRQKEAGMLKDYVSAGAQAREKYKDVWDPFARDTLASKQVALNYAPIADVRSELAMRAEALGVATNAAQTAYATDLEKSKTNLGFTQSAYERAAAREAAAAAKAENEAQRAFQASENAKSRSYKEKTADPGYKFNVVNKEDTNGNMKGIEITDSTGKPITLNTYISGYATDNYTPADFIPYLSRSEDPGDKQVITDIQSGMTTAELIKKYPYIFGE